MLIYFVRHGQTDDNLTGIIQGHIDTPLNDHGRRESARVAERLRDVSFAEAWTSTLSRARETAENIAGLHPGLELRQDEGLKERYLGSLQGRRWARGSPLPEDVEAGEAFRERISAWLKNFLARHEDAARMTANGAHNPNEAGFVTDAEPKILVVSHGAYLSSLLPLLLTPSKTWTITAAPDVDLKAHCQNTSIMRVRLRPPVRKGTAGEMNGASGSSGRDKGNKWVGVVESWGDVEHLAGLWEKDLDVADDVR